MPMMRCYYVNQHKLNNGHGRPQTEDNIMFGFGDVVAILILTWVCMLYIAMDLAGVIS